MLFAFTFSNSQNIVGIVCDDHNKPITGAKVFLHGTTHVSITNHEGVFIMSKSNIISKELCVFHEKHKFYMNNKINEIKDTLKINLTKENQNEYLYNNRLINLEKDKIKDFEMELLGNDEFGDSCEISNIESICFVKDLDMNNEYKTIKPIIIINNKLGYKLYVFIYKFKKTVEEYRNTGVYITKIDNNSHYYFEDIENPLIYQNARKMAYLGSKNHFLKALVDGKLKENNFEIHKNFNFKDIKKYFEITKINEDFYKIYLNMKLFNIDLKNKMFTKIPISFKGRNSTLYSTTNEIIIDKYGNIYDTKNTFFNHDMSKYRIGKTLPLDYEYN